jgi:ribosomal protein L1
VFAEGKKAEEAKKAGADIVGGLELCEAVSNACIIHRQFS